MTAYGETKLRLYKRYIYLAICVGSVICICKIIGKQAFDITLLGMEFSTESASSLIVRDQRGHEPYMTIKMKCFYCDESEVYGESWEEVTNDIGCQQGLLNNCFANRTLKDRHETHVLALYNFCQINQCSCNDASGWCSSTSCKNLKCCLDTGKNSVIC